MEEKCMLGNLGSGSFKMAASSSSGRIWTLCKQFQNGFRISSLVNAQHCAVSLTRGQSKHFRYEMCHVSLKISQEKTVVFAVLIYPNPKHCNYYKSICLHDCFSSN